MKNTIKHTLLLSLGVSLLTIGANTTQAATALTITAAGSTNNNSWFSGFAFSTTSTIYVTDLGIIDVDGGGLDFTDQDVGLYKASDGALLATVNILDSATSEVNGVYNAYFASIPELTLAAGSYIVAAEIKTLSLSGATEVYASGITLVGGVADSGKTLLADGSGGTGDYSHTSSNAYSGANFKFSTTPTVAVPEPSSTALLGLGGLALILRRRK